MKPRHSNPFLARLCNRHTLASLGSLTLAITSQTAPGATVYWDRNGTTAGAGGNGNIGGNWLDTSWNDVADGTGTLGPHGWVSGDSAVFSAGTDATGAWTVNLQGNTITTPSITFEDRGGDNGKTLSNGTIVIGGGTLNSSAWGSGTSGNHGADVVVSTVLAGSGGITIAAHGNEITDGGGGGGSEFRLDANNTFTGGLTITSGIVSWRNDAHFGPAANEITMNGGGLVYTDQERFVLPRTVNVGNNGGTIRLYGGKTLMVTGPIKNVNAGTPTTFRRTDGGTLQLVGSINGFNGTFINGNSDTQFYQSDLDLSDVKLRINAGNVQMLTGNALPLGSLEIVGGELNLNYGTPATLGDGNVLVNGGTIRSSIGSLGSLTSSTGTLTFTGGAATGDLSGSAQVQVRLTNSGATPVGVVKNNNANLVLTRSNTYSGGTSINGGRVEASNGGAFGSGPVTVAGGGQAWLRSNVPFANSFTLNGNGPTEGANAYGALRFSGPSNVSGPVLVASASRVSVYESEDTGIISGALSGSGALEKTGGGILSISGDNSAYTGAVTSAQGILHIGSNLPGSSVTLNTNAALAGESSIGGGLTLNNASALYVDGSTAGALSTTNLTVNGVTLVNLLGMPAVPGAQFNVINYSGALSMSGTVDQAFVLANGSSYRNAPVFADTGTAIAVTVPAGSNLVWAGTDATNPSFWDNAVTSNWMNGPTPDAFYAGDNVLFDDTGTTKTVALKSMLSPATITFNNSVGNDYTLTGAGGVGFSGPTNIVKNGGGRTTIQGYGHNYTGTVVVNAGFLQPSGNYEVLGNSSGLTVNSGGQFNINGMKLGNFQRHYRFTIAGNGPDGSGALNNTHTDSPNESAGILDLVLTGDAKVGTTGGRYDIGRSGDSFGSITGNGYTLTKVGTGIVCMRAPATNITYVVDGGTLKFEDSPLGLGANAITVNNGTLQAYGYQEFSNPVNLAAGTTLDNDGGGRQTWTGPITLTGLAGTAVNLKATNDALYLSNVISGLSGITTAGGNNVFLTGSVSNTFAGLTRMNSNGQLILGKTGGAVAVPGDLSITNTADRPILSFTADNQFGPNSVIHLSGTAQSRIELKGTRQTVAGLDYPVATAGEKQIQHHEYGFPIPVDGFSDLVINVAAATTYTYAGGMRDLGGSLNVEKTGPGTQVLAGNAIDYRGTTKVLQGRLVGNGDDSWTSVLTISAGATYEANVNSAVGADGYEQRCPGFLLNGAGTYQKTGIGRMAITWDGGGSVAMSPGALIDIQAGEFQLEWGGGNWTNNKSDMFIAAGAALNLWDNNNAGVFVNALNGPGNVIRDRPGAGPWNDTGSITVGANDGGGNFTGGISNSDGSKTHFIKVGTGTQTLGGACTHSGNTTVTGGTLAFSNTSSLKFYVTDAAANQVAGTGAVNFDGAFDIDVSAVTVATGNWTLVNAATLTEAFGATFTVSGGWTEASNVWTKVVGNKRFTFKESDGTLTVGPNASYASWIDGYFPGQTDQNIIGKDADPDGDGISNAVEMVLGGNPATGMDTALLPTIELVTDPAGVPAGNYLAVTYRRTDLSVDGGVVASLEYDLDLQGTWTTAQDGVNGVKILVDDNYGSFVPPAAANTDRVRVYVPRSGNATLFGRGRATAP